MPAKTIFPFVFVFASLCGSLVAEDAKRFEVDVDARPISAGDHRPLVSYADTLERATPSVVAVYTSRIRRVVPQQQVPPGVQELFRHFGLPSPHGPRDYSRGAEPQQPGGRERMERVGVGSGVIVSKD